MNDLTLPFAQTRLTIGAVLLAAGAGSRLGNKPKSLLELDGVPLIHRQLNALSEAGVTEIVVVLGHYAAQIEAAVRGFVVAANVKTIQNPSPDDGQATSLRLGLQNLNDPLDAVIVALADQPLLDADDVTALIAAFRNRVDGALMAVPRVAGAPGNPVILDAALRSEWLQNEKHDTGRGWRETNPQRVQWFDSDNTHYRVDIDTPADITRFTERTNRTLCWPTDSNTGQP